ncbi:MAG TPA: hypothetical protein VFU49_19680 [Ktedonobacteraceae bacterium]|nr:hypothetical protein [Ktedonobacteraceae bacterium]
MFIAFFAFILFVCLFLAGGLLFHLFLFPRPAFRALAGRPVTDATQTARLHAAIFR